MAQKILAKLIHICTGGLVSEIVIFLVTGKTSFLNYLLNCGNHLVEKETLHMTHTYTYTHSFAIYIYSLPMWPQTFFNYSLAIDHQN